VYEPCRQEPRKWSIRQISSTSAKPYTPGLQDGVISLPPYPSPSSSTGRNTSPTGLVAALTQATSTFGSELIIASSSTSSTPIQTGSVTPPPGGPDRTTILIQTIVPLFCALIGAAALYICRERVHELWARVHGSALESPGNLSNTSIHAHTADDAAFITRNNTSSRPSAVVIIACLLFIVGFAYGHQRTPRRGIMSSG